jgi:uncharacterized YccA/Bax inhibitor family protein
MGMLILGCIALAIGVLSALLVNLCEEFSSCTGFVEAIAHRKCGISFMILGAVLLSWGFVCDVASIRSYGCFVLVVSLPLFFNAPSLLEHLRVAIRGYRERRSPQWLEFYDKEMEEFLLNGRR